VLPEALAEALVEALPDVPVAEDDWPDIEPPDAPPDVTLARMKLSAFEASPAAALLPPPLAGCRHPVTVTLSSDCLPPAWRLPLWPLWPP